MKIKKTSKPVVELTLLFLSALFVFALQFFFSNIKNIYNSKAQTAGKTLTVCDSGCLYSGASGIQQAIDAAKDGDTILIQSGDYRSTDPIVVDPNYKFQNCLVDTKGKKITIKGAGAVTLDNANGNLDNQQKWSTGICIMGGEVTIDSITIRQTLRPAIYIQNARAIVKNVTFLDIDNNSVEVHQSQTMFLNNLFAGSAGSGISIDDISYARIENNTFKGGGVSFNTCGNNEPTGDVSKNIITQSNVVATCPEQTQKLANIKVSNNFVFKGITTGDPSCVSSENGVGDCGTGEICTGTTFVWPEFNGADEKGTVCVWGEGRIQGDFNTKPTSPAGLAGAGISKGSCANSDSAQCTNYIASNPLPGNTQPTPTSTPVPTVSLTPTGLSTPTPTLVSSDIRLNLKLKFQGIVNSPKDQYNLMKVKVTLQKKSGGGTGKTVDFIADSSGVWSGSVIFPQMAEGSDYQLFIKGPKHLQRKICNNSPTENTPGIYKCDETAGISLTLGENNLDLTGIYLFAGDFNQDGIVDSTDVSSVRTSLGKSDSQSLSSCDLNNDGVCDTQDFSLVIEALRVRFDDEK